MRRLWCKEPIVGKLEPRGVSVHAMCILAPKAGNTHLKGQVPEHGYLVFGPGLGE